MASSPHPSQAPSTMELESIPPSPHPEDGIIINTSHEVELPPLPRVDGGKDAWLFLAACFMIEALVWGFPYSFGIFQSHYSTHPPFSSSPANIATIGTCALGIMYLDTPLVMSLHRRYPKHARHSTIVGLIIMCLALVLSSFSTTVTHLIVTQGIFYAVGGSIAYASCIVYLEEWFVARRGLAYGIMWSATGLAGVILPLVLERLLNEKGYVFTLRVFGALVFALTAPLAWFIRPRLPIAQASSAASPSRRPWRHGLGFIATKQFWLYQGANVIESVGYFLPGIYLPSYARGVLGAGSLSGVVTMMLINVASVFGCVAMGSLIDRLEVTTCFMVSTIGATLGTFLLWGFSVNLPVLYTFCVVYGLFAGSYTSAWPGVMKEMNKIAMASQGEDGRSTRASDPSMVFAFLAMGRGVGNVVSGPLSEALIKGAPWKGQAFGGYGSGYGGLIAFTGATAFLGGGSYVWKRLGWL